MESKKINQLATELTPSLDDLTIIGDPSTGISKKITLSQMAALFTGTVEEYASLAAFPLVGVADTIYIATDTNILYRWSTSLNAYVELSPNIISSLVFNDSNGFDGTISLVGSTATLTITTTLTSGSVAFGGASGALSQDNTNFYWDNSNKRLGINTNAPTVALDAFGSGIIGRVNGTSTNNAFLGFASAGTNKWSIGNVQSDHRFRIYNEATTSELVSVLQTGEFGIGIANPTTKFHIDGAASALIVNLDANVSIAKSISFRSDNSNRWNIEVSGTESTGNAGMDFFLRSYSDAGALIETPLSIVRSTGVTTIKSLTLTNALSVANGGTGSTTFTAGRVLFGNGTSAINTSANLFWDNTNGRLGLGTDAPAVPFHILTSGLPLIRIVAGSEARTHNISAVNNGRDLQILPFRGLTLQTGNGIAEGVMTLNAYENLVIGTGASYTTRLTITSDGFVGIGNTPKIFNGTTAQALQVGTSVVGTLAASSSYGTVVGTNVYYFSGYKRTLAQASSFMTFDGDTIYFYNAASGAADSAITATPRMTMSSGGSFGIGVTPSAWGSSIPALQVAAYGSFSTAGGVDTQISNNAYYDGTNWRYIASQEAANYYMNRDTHVWRYKSAGTAGGTITWNEAMRLNNAGALLINTTTAQNVATNRGNLTINGVTSILNLSTNDTNAGYLYHNGTNLQLVNSKNGDLLLYTNDNLNATLTSAGNLVMNQKLVTSFTVNPSNVNSGASTSYSITQPTFEYQSTYLVSIIGLYTSSGSNQNGFGTGFVTFFNDSAVAQANATTTHANGWSISASANTSGTFTFTFTNTAGTQMSNIWIRILKLNKTFGN